MANQPHTQLMRQAWEAIIEFTERHPVLVRMIGISVAAVLGAIIFPPLISGLAHALGFGPLGPIVGSPAALFQSAFLGAAVPAGHIFGALQAVGQTSTMSAWVSAIGAGIGGVIGVML